MKNDRVVFLVTFLVTFLASFAGAAIVGTSLPCAMWRAQDRPGLKATWLAPMAPRVEWAVSGELRYGRLTKGPSCWLWLQLDGSHQSRPFIIDLDQQSCTDAGMRLPLESPQ